MITAIALVLIVALAAIVYNVFKYRRDIILGFVVTIAIWIANHNSRHHDIER